MPRHLPRIARSLLFPSALLLTVLVGCNNNDHDNNDVPQPGLASTQSSSIALSKSGNFLVVANPDVNTISVFQPTTLAKIGEITVGAGPESVAIHEGSLRTAFVANSQSGTVSVVTLPSGPVRQTIQVGKGPMGVALSPNGTRLYVAESADNSLSVFDATSYAPVATVDLSSHGSSPRAIAVTDDGDADDADETVFVAMFFAHLRPGKTSVEEGQDDQREGHVIAVSAATHTVIDHVALAPMAVTGFNSNGQLAPGPGLVPEVASTNPQTFTRPTAAFPNQLASIAIRPGTGLGYVVSTGASPNGPLRFNQMVQGLVSVFDVAALTEVTAAQTGATLRQEAPLNLNRGINLDTAAVPRLFLSNPVAMAWRPNGNDAWVVVQNTDVVVRLTADATGVPTIGTPLVAGPGQIVRLDLQAVSGTDIAGKAPRGIVINAAGTRAFVHNFISRSVTAIDITEGQPPAILGTAQSTAPPAPGSAAATRQLGAELFHTGRGPDGRMSSESWGGCIVCHPNGRTDNVTWMFEAGPRQTIPLDGMFAKGDPSDQRILNWSAVRDENHDFELNTRGVFGGRGLIDDDRLLFVIGGASGATPDDSAVVEQLQQVTGAIGTTNDLATGQALPALPSARRDFAVATLDDARVFMIGGRSGSGQGSLVGAANAVLEFNPRTNSITPKSSTGFTLRHSLGAAAVKTSAGPRIYAIGGYPSTVATEAPVATV
ncbi:MAG TPA: YncE family protein, partial [Planctomycetota bacterium]|nr:YncE family protein [Planctomycetota bacterium]